MMESYNSIQGFDCFQNYLHIHLRVYASINIQGVMTNSTGLAHLISSHMTNELLFSVFH